MLTDLLLYLSFGEEKKNAFFSLFYSSFLFFPSPTLFFCRLDPPLSLFYSSSLFFPSTLLFCRLDPPLSLFYSSSLFFPSPTLLFCRLDPPLSLFYSSSLFIPSPTLLFCRLDPPVCPSYQLSSQTTALLDIWLDSPSVGLPVSFPIARIWTVWVVFT